MIRMGLLTCVPTTMGSLKLEMFSGFIQDYDLYLNALLASLLISYASAPIGVFLNLKRMTLMGEAISHSLLPGFALAFMMYGMSYGGLILGGLFAGLLVLGLMMGLSRFVTIKEDGVLTIVYLTFSAFGILIVLKSGIKIDLSHILIGNILLIDQAWLLILFFSSIAIRIIFSRIRKNLLIVLMDPEYALFLKIPIQRVKSIFYFLVLWILVLCFYSVGTLLALGLLMIPALLAKVAVKSIDQQIRWGLGFGTLMSLVGLMASVGLDWPTGPTIILSGGVLFGLVISGKPVLTRFLVFSVALLFIHPLAMADSVNKDQILISNSYLKLFINHLVSPANHLAVQTLVPGDQSIHNYQLKPSDMKKIKQAKLFLYIGNGMEAALKDQVIRVNSSLKTINLTEKIKFEPDLNEHFWMNPESALLILDALKTVLVEQNSDWKENMDAKSTQAKFQILNFTTQLRDKFRPYKNQPILFSHNSLYFLDSLLGIQAHFYISSTRPSDVLIVKKLLKDSEIPIIKEYGALDFLFESMVKDQKRSFAGDVYGETIPSEMCEDKTYLDILKANVDTIFAILAKNKTQAESSHQKPSQAQ